MNQDSIEICSGCGDVQPQHPMVGVTKDEDGKWAAFPVCNECWTNPAHRQRVLKMHFFHRGDAALAVRLAGSANIGG